MVVLVSRLRKGNVKGIADKELRKNISIMGGFITCYSHRSRRKIKFIGIVSAVIIVSLFVLQQLTMETFDLVIPLESGNESTEFVDGKCVLPVIDPFRTDVMNLVRKLPPIKCNGKKRYGTVIGQQLRLDVNGLRKADIKYITRRDGDDFNVEFSEAIQLDLSKTGIEFNSFIF